ncbi:sporulation histidine kinase inhibitor Sda [Halalkalibacter oceani]|uniref:Sporulation histidine kinase inhibitor Sda n=1 Tax=Halalkalibacter oceani TaxID=1653776 RepID=A0A9X2DNB1_9BACI|nr:sporulation histidine kinase inhibitor Sda [Halalkalibacter oceani]MCM3713297.1 sporulation histidine kinase inhibitor Sda [Halalkalibacter oceani]
MYITCYNKSLEKLTDDKLQEALAEAIKCGLEHDFIETLKNELKVRELKSV